MRIGISALAMEPGGGGSGVPRYCFRLLGALLELGTDDRFVVAAPADFEPPREWSSTGRIEVVPATGVLARKKTLWDMFRAGSFAKQHEVEVWMSTAHALPLRPPAPCVLAVHDLFFLSHPKLYTFKERAVLTAAIRHAVRRARRFLAVSEFSKHELCVRLGVSPDKVAVTLLGPGNDVKPVSPGAVDDRDLVRIGNPFSKYLLTLGAIGPRKNLPRLIEAFSLLCGEPEFEEVGLVIAGSKGDGSAARAARQLGISERVRFLGYVPDDDLPALFARCEAFVMPSLTEGFGVPIVEAMALGAPVVSSKGGSLPEIGGDAATYFDPLSVPSIAHALREALRVGPKRLSIVEKGRAQAAKFTWQDCAAKTLHVLRSLADPQVR